MSRTPAQEDSGGSNVELLEVIAFNLKDSVRASRWAQTMCKGARCYRLTVFRCLNAKIWASPWSSFSVLSSKFQTNFYLTVEYLPFNINFLYGHKLLRFLEVFLKGFWWNVKSLYKLFLNINIRIYKSQETSCMLLLYIVSYLFFICLYFICIFCIFDNCTSAEVTSWDQ